AGGAPDAGGGVAERDASGEPTGILREVSAWRYRDLHMKASATEYVDAMRAGVKLASSRGVTAVHDKDGWLGALGLWQQLGQRSLRVWQSVPAAQVEHLAALGLE